MMDRADIDDYEQNAKPFIRTAAAFLIFLVRGASTIAGPAEIEHCYETADEFMERLDGELRK